MGCGASARRDRHVVYVGAKVEEMASNSDDASRHARLAAVRTDDVSSRPVRVRSREDKDMQVMVQRLRGSTSKACRRLGAELEESLTSRDTATKADVGMGQPPIAWPRSLDTPLEWDAYLHGPPGTLYEGGVFYLALWFPEEYPWKPPRAEFVTPCFHPNISERGKICLNVLKEEWSPMLVVSSLLLCISGLLSQPNPDDPLNEEAAELLTGNPAEYARIAADWTRRYARPKARFQAARSSPACKALSPNAEDDLSMDPMSTYQSVGGRPLSEEEAMARALQDSAKPAQPFSQARRVC